jgi:hypothetical protein
MFTEFTGCDLNRQSSTWYSVKSDAGYGGSIKAQDETRCSPTGEFLRVNALVQQPARPSAPERLVTAGAATPAGALKACVHGEARRDCNVRTVAVAAAADRLCAGRRLHCSVPSACTAGVRVSAAAAASGNQGTSGVAAAAYCGRPSPTRRHREGGPADAIGRPGTPLLLPILVCHRFSNDHVPTK